MSKKSNIRSFFPKMEKNAPDVLVSPLAKNAKRAIEDDKDDRPASKKISKGVNFPSSSDIVKRDSDPSITVHTKKEACCCHHWRNTR